ESPSDAARISCPFRSRASLKRPMFAGLSSIISIFSGVIMRRMSRVQSRIEPVSGPLRVGWSSYRSSPEIGANVEQDGSLTDQVARPPLSNFLSRSHCAIRQLSLTSAPDPRKGSIVLGRLTHPVPIGRLVSLRGQT